MSRRLIRTLGVLLCGGVSGGACEASSVAPDVAIETRLLLPRALLDRATRLGLTVFEGGSCNATTGAVDATTATTLLTVELSRSGCAPGARFCGPVTVEKSDATRIFSAVATDAGGAKLAVGCATAKVDQDALPLSITMFRYLAPAACNDGVVQPTEQCEPGGSAICDDGCLSKELLLSTGSTQNGTQTGVASDKTAPFFLWPSAAGEGGRFFAFFSDRAVTGSNNVEVTLRAMGDDLSPLTTPPALAAGSIYLPNGATFPPPPSPRQQSLPQAALLEGKYYVVFQDDDTAGATNGLDIHLRSMDSALVAGQGATPIGINGPAGAGEAAIQGAPAIAAGPTSRLFVAWEDAGQGKIAGRTLTPPSTLGNQNDLSTGTGNKGVSVAATTTGWVAAWQSGTGIKLRIVNEDGTPQGAEETVNERPAVDRPRVASLPDGRFAVTWTAGGAVFVQRYDARGVKLAGDQAAPIGGTAAVAPWVASTSAVGGSYVVAWLEGTAHVFARMLGGTSGFLFNHVDGQSGAFQASRADGRTRANPVVVAGGAGPFVAIGWEDQTMPNAGIVVRRFPLPVE